MTSGSSNFNTFPANQLTTFRAVQAVLWNSTLLPWQKCRYCLKLFSEVPVRSAGAYRHTLSPDVDGGVKVKWWVDVGMLSGSVMPLLSVENRERSSQLLMLASSGGW